MPIVVAFRNRTVTAALYGPVLLTHWYAAPDVASLRGVSATQEQWMRVAGVGLGAVTVIDPDAGHALSPAARAESVAMQRAARGRVVAIATIVPDLGFRASLVRSVLTGLSLLSAHDAAESVFSTADAAARWLSPRLRAQRAAVEATGLGAAIEEIMSAAPARA